MAFGCADSFPTLGSPDPSIPLTSLLSARFARNLEPVSSPWCKNLTLSCPVKGEGPTWSGAQPTRLFLGLLLPRLAKLHRSPSPLLTADFCCHFQGNH